LNNRLIHTNSHKSIGTSEIHEFYLKKQTFDKVVTNKNDMKTLKLNKNEGIVRYTLLVSFLLINNLNGMGQNILGSTQRVSNLSGPRFGVTILTGEIADTLRSKYDAAPVILQFGWQFEWQFFSTDTGPTGVVEVVPLIGGLEKGLFLPSLSALVGMRFLSGFEFGFGPNVSLTGFSIALAVGKTFQTGQLNWPVNFSIVPSQKGARFSILLGFNAAG